MDLRQHYLDYISAINDGCKPGALDPFVHEGVVHNDSPPLSVAGYAKNITDAQASFSDLSFNVEMIVVEPDGDQEGFGHLAVRIRLAFRPTPGQKETFYEHVFYRLEAGKIRRVWSMLDGAGLKWAEERASAGN
ncbi:NTF2-like superfamily protein [Cladophialophora carrionii]|uniref:NTF2-like superfamily protein n=1 Tax=Cladophialophora carrionii TaxID=86049 RepID=A0A1C1CA86_9EURO|nr:NTF2-like superfamily protein [Cladophialophora carrionii]